MRKSSSSGDGISSIYLFTALDPFTAIHWKLLQVFSTSQQLERKAGNKCSKRSCVSIQKIGPLDLNYSISHLETLVVTLNYRGVLVKSHDHHESLC